MSDTFCQITFGKTRSDIYIQEKQNFLRYNNRNKNTIIPSVICEDSLVLSLREFYTSNIKFLDDMTGYCLSSQTGFRVELEPDQ